MGERVMVSETLALEIVAGGRDPHVAVARDGGGLVAVRPDELRDLVAGLVRAAEVLARAAAKEAKK